LGRNQSNSSKGNFSISLFNEKCFFILYTTFLNLPLFAQWQTIYHPFTTCIIFEIDPRINRQDLVLVMYDVFGRKVREFKITDYKFQIPRNELFSGIYFYKIFSENKILYTGKIIAK